MWTHVTFCHSAHPLKHQTLCGGGRGLGLDICSVYSASMAISVIVLERPKVSHSNMQHLVGEQGEEIDICL